MTQLQGFENIAAGQDEQDPDANKPKGPSVNPEVVVRWAKDQFHTIKDARSPLERQWYLNLAFFFGRQNVVMNSNRLVDSSRILRVPPAPYYRVRHVANMIRPKIRKELARLTSQKPTASVIPSSSEDRDLFAAQAGEQIWDSVYRRKKVQAVIRRALFWTLICGTGFVKTAWDEFAIDREANQMGDFSLCSETPFHIFVPDMRIEDIEEQPFVIHAQLKTREKLALMFPGLQFSESDEKGTELLNDAWIGLMGANSAMDKKSVLCLEVWVKPGEVKHFPQGAMFTIVGNELVQYREGWPYDHQMYPFAKLDNIPSGKFYADSVIVDLIPLQRAYNKTRSQIIEAKDRMGKPQLTAVEGSIVPKKITSEPGLVITYKAGFERPTPLPLQPLPAYILQELERLRIDMDDISGQHDISKGQVPPGVTAATAISYLQEQDESMLAHTFHSLEEGIEKIAQMVLSYVAQFWDYQRTIKVVGQDGSFDVLAFKGADLGGNTDIRVEAGSALPTSKAAKQAFIMDMMKMGFIDPNSGLEVLEMGGLGKIYEKIKVDIRQAQRENLRMAAATPDQIELFNQGMAVDVEQNKEKYFDIVTGQPKTMIDVKGDPLFPLMVPVNVWDEHRLHVEEHNRFRKSQAFEALDQRAKDLFDEHVRQHVSQIVVGQMATMFAGPPPPGGPEGQSGPPGPPKGSGESGPASDSPGPPDGMG